MQSNNRYHIKSQIHRIRELISREVPGWERERRENPLEEEEGETLEGKDPNFLKLARFRGDGDAVTEIPKGIVGISGSGVCVLVSE